MRIEDILTEHGREPRIPLSSVELPPGWSGLVHRLIDDLLALGWSGHLAQITQRGAALRFYSDDPNTSGAMIERIWRAGWESVRTCERCGTASRPRTARREAQTLCDAHAASSC